MTQPESPMQQMAGLGKVFSTTFLMWCQAHYLCLQMIQNYIDILLLQRDIDKLFTWNREWQFFFSYEKCYAMSLNRSPDIYNYNMADGDNVARITQAYGEKDLGVFFSPGLKFRRHILNIIHKANTITRIVKRSFEF